MQPGTDNPANIRCSNRRRLERGLGKRAGMVIFAKAFHVMGGPVKPIGFNLVLALFYLDTSPWSRVCEGLHSERTGGLPDHTAEVEALKAIILCPRASLSELSPAQLPLRQAAAFDRD